MDINPASFDSQDFDRAFTPHVSRVVTFLSFDRAYRSLSDIASCSQVPAKGKRKSKALSGYIRQIE